MENINKMIERVYEECKDLDKYTLRFYNPFKKDYFFPTEEEPLYFISKLNVYAIKVTRFIKSYNELNKRVGFDYDDENRNVDNKRKFYHIKIKAGDFINYTKLMMTLLSEKHHSNMGE